MGLRRGGAKGFFVYYYFLLLLLFRCHSRFGFGSGVCAFALAAQEKGDAEFTFLLPAGTADCFFQTTRRNGTMEVEFQVISGAGMDIDFALLSPQGFQLISEFRRSDGVHMVDPTEEGDYQICFGNRFSRFSEKTVFFEVMVEGPGGGERGGGGGDELEEAELEESLLEYKLEDIRDSMDSVHRRLDRSRQIQAALRAFEARDRNLLEDNLWKVSFWSSISLLVMLGVALMQVYTVRKLFDVKRRVCT
ncbi:hypothetical protein NHX12_017519 [Muraenolepis orangiensis]|uniref:GOLD domain-containing protein n=1 Tax=Muraenolepis orangiensis TaxID=630683 RepID=A0A9Q0EY22_9TELE|nr:hypothetical protein NHX12_017519 [Muraenolepis orangiensis]